MRKPIVIVGDSMLDVDIEGDATRLSPEAPVPVVDAKRIWHRPGGAGLAAVLAARADSDVVLVTALADDPDGRALVDLLTSAGVTVIGLPMAGNTVCKTRIRAAGQSMLRLDHGDGSAVTDAVPQTLDAVFDDARAICVADYGHGVTSHPGIRERLMAAAGRIPVVWDPHPRGAAPTEGCWLVTPNQLEAEGVSADDDAHSAESLRRRWHARALCITLGARGAMLADSDGTTHIPVPASASGTGRGDTCGAGDRFAIAATAALGAGDNAREAVTAAVEAASRFVAAGGAVGVSSAASLGKSGSAAGESEAVNADVATVREKVCLFC